MITKIGRILAADIVLGGNYNHEVQLLLIFGAETWNGQPNSKWFTKVADTIGYAQLGDSSSTTISKLVPILHAANVNSISALVSKPVICYFDEGSLTSWSILNTI